VDSSGNVTLRCVNPNPTCTHSTGLSLTVSVGGIPVTTPVTYTDCSDPLGFPGDQTTYTFAMAQDAATQYDAAIGSPTNSILSGQCDGGVGNALSLAVTNSSGAQTDVIVWTFAGPNAGHVHDDGGPNGPVCPTSSDPTWN
jgi:hypothetical protein